MLHFEPLKEMILEKLSAIPEFFSSTGLTVTEYLKQAPTQDMRLFIWTLEEYRENYMSCHAILDEYFDMMGGYFDLIQRLIHKLFNDFTPLILFHRWTLLGLKKV